MRFSVPQFIDVEDKIFGPLTFKQFVYLIGGAGISFLLWKTIPKLIAILLIVPVAGFALALAFYKVNERPFAYIVEAWFKYITKSKLYLWKKPPPKKKKPAEKPKEEEEKKYIPKLSASKLSDLAWGLDIKDMSQK